MRTAGRSNVRSRLARPLLGWSDPEPSGGWTMAAQKPLNIGLVGYGFMGRTHSNGYKRVNDFFDLEYRPVLKAVCGRSEENARAFAGRGGYESIETHWRGLPPGEAKRTLTVLT